MDTVVTTQKALTIASPSSQIVVKAYKYPPPAETVLPDTPCFMNTWTLLEEKRLPNGGRQQLYVVRMQFFVQDADADRAADIATAFFGALVTAFDAAISLHGACTTQKLRGGSPTLVRLERAGQSYIGFDAMLDVFMDENVANYAA